MISHRNNRTKSRRSAGLAKKTRAFSHSSRTPRPTTKGRAVRARQGDQLGVEGCGGPEASAPYRPVHSWEAYGSRLLSHGGVTTLRPEAAVGVTQSLRGIYRYNNGIDKQSRVWRSSPLLVLAAWFYKRTCGGGVGGRAKAAKY